MKRDKVRRSINKDATDMEERENYTSLLSSQHQEENRPFLKSANGVLSVCMANILRD